MESVVEKKKDHPLNLKKTTRSMVNHVVLDWKKGWMDQNTLFGWKKGRMDQNTLFGWKKGWMVRNVLFGWKKGWMVF